ncbi:MAG: hypothetical protein ACYC28_14390 [Longimicrobiales bacterium]
MIGAQEGSDEMVLLEAQVAALASTLESSDCGTLAETVVERVGGRTVGYFIRDNPSATLGVREDGHTFVIVDHRYLIDIWAKDVVMATDRYVFDLHAPSDARLVGSLWGSIHNWEEWTGCEMIPFRFVPDRSAAN